MFERLQEIRSRLGLTTREVAERSEKIAVEEANDEFRISNAWLTEVETSDAVPSIYKLYTLSVIYHIKFTDLLLMYGVDLEKISKQRMLMPPKQTYTVPIEVFDEEKAAIFPVRFDQGFNVGQTNLLSRMVEIWGEVPIGLIRYLDFRTSMYGYIGLQDFTLYPLLRPGSFVQVDQNLKRIESTKGISEYHRPIYFLEYRGGYACSWCELQGNRLILLPHPLSPASVRQFEFPKEISVVGRVTGVAMRIMDPVITEHSESVQLPKRP